MSNKTFSVKEQKTFSASEKKFSVDGKYSIDFSLCTVKDHPADKRSFSEVIETLKCFSESCLLETRNRHKLTNKSTGKESDRISGFINTHKTVYSVDVFHRNGKHGNIRLLYTPDFDNASLIHVLDCFIDTH